MHIGVLFNTEHCTCHHSDKYSKTYNHYILSKERQWQRLTSRDNKIFIILPCSSFILFVWRWFFISSKCCPNYHSYSSRLDDLISDDLLKSIHFNYVRSGCFGIHIASRNLYVFTIFGIIYYFRLSMSLVFTMAFSQQNYGVDLKVAI
jgi:hypothetical protein